MTSDLAKCDHNKVESEKKCVSKGETTKPNSGNAKIRLKYNMDLQLYLTVLSVLVAHHSVVVIAECLAGDFNLTALEIW